MARLSQQRRELIYSLFLVIFIPLCLIGGALWLTSQVKLNYDQELRRKANLANEVFGVSVAGALTSNTTDPAAVLLQSLIDATRRQAPEIDQLTVTIGRGSELQVLASSDTSLVRQADTTIQSQLAYSKQNAIASLIASGEGNDREWLVATPILSPSGSVLAVSTMRVSLAAADQAMNAALMSSFIVLTVILLAVIALLLHHFRFVEYAELFRKQKELDQMKDDFISVATHELKAPMSIIKGYISMAQEETDLPKINEMLTIAFNQTDRLNHLVTDLLDVSRLEQGRTKYSVEKVDLAVVIKPMLAVFKMKAEAKQLTLDYQAPTSLPDVAADPNRVSEVFTNLIDNAIKYSRTGAVTITHAFDATTVTTTVADTGIGMTPDEQSRLFQRFYRARNDDTADIEGTGLGLWIIHQYIDHMNGSIRLESEKGVGSKFIVVLPRAN